MKIISSLCIFSIFIVYVVSIELQFPATAPCILFSVADDSHVDIKNATGDMVSYDFSMATVTAGSSDCGSGANPMPKIVLRVGESDAEITFTRQADESTVMNILLKFIPSNVFPRTPDTSLQVADDTSNTVKPPKDRSYKCESEEVISFGNTLANYTVQMFISGAQIQGYDVSNGAFSEASVCAADAASSPQPSTEPPTTQHANGTTANTNVTTQQPTTHNANGTTAGTNGTTEQPTTHHNNGTTEQPTTQHSNVTNGTTPSTTPATTTPVPPSTTPTPAAPKNNFELRSGNDTCVVFQASMSFDITYDVADGKTATRKIIVPNTTTIDGSSNCNYTDFEQNLVLKFYNDWMLSLIFAHEGSSTTLALKDGQKFYLKTVDFTYDITTDRFPGATKPGKVQTVTEMADGTFSATKDGSFKCDKDTKLTLNNTSTLTMDVGQLQYYAFATGNFTGSFGGDTAECASDTETNSIVPIAVGAALAGLVIIVLIAYLIGRKRSRGGYEQV